MKKQITTTILFLISLSIVPFSLAQSQFQFTYQTEVSIETYSDIASNGDILFAMDSYNDTADFFHRIILQRLDLQGNVKQTSGIFRPPSFRLTGGIKAVANNEVLMLGTVNIPLEDADSVFIVKLDDMGQVSWSKGYQVEPNIHIPRGAIETSDGNYLVYGTYEHINFAEGIFLLKIDPSGNLIWSRTINSQLAGAFMKVGGIVETASGDFWLSGSTRFNSEGSWLAKLNNLGETQSVIFYNTHDLTPSQPEPFAIFQRSNGELDIFYNSTTFDTGPIMLAVHSDAAGMPINSTRFFSGNGFGEITAIQPNGNDGYIAAGYKFAPNSNRSDGFAMEISSDYSTSWARNYGSDYIEIINSIFQTSDNGHVLSGFADFDSVIISPSENGLFPWLVKADGTGRSTCYNANSSATKKDTTVTTMNYQLDNVPGKSLGNISFTNIPVNPPIDSVTCMATAIEIFPTNHFTAYPNPSQGRLFIDFADTQIQSIEVYDLLGRKVMARIIKGNQRIEIISTYKGMALVRIKTKNGIWSKKILFEGK